MTTQTKSTKKSFDKEKSLEQFHREYPEDTTKSERLIITPELLKTVMERYPDEPNLDIADSLGITYSQLTSILDLLRKKGISLLKKQQGLKASFEEAFLKLNIEIKK